jgi:hypothetical protein
MKQTRPSFNFPYSRNHRQQRIGSHPSEQSSLETPMGTMANPLYMVRVNGAGQLRPRSRNLDTPGETAPIEPEPRLKLGGGLTSFRHPLRLKIDL